MKPGPGNYSSLDESFTKKTAPKYGFGTGSREELVNSKNPTKVGPGAYEISPFIGKEGKSSSISPKLNDIFQEKESRNKPGPGSYE